MFYMTFRLKIPISVFVVDSFAPHLRLSSTRIHAKHSSSHTCFLHTCHSLPELSSTRQRLNTKAGSCFKQQQPKPQGLQTWAVAKSVAEYERQRGREAEC